MLIITTDPRKQKKRGIVIVNIKKIVTHFNPHFDELVAVFLGLNFGQSAFEGIDRAVWQEATRKLPDGKTWRDYPDTLFIGCAGSPFDEHGLKGRKTCSAQLVVEYVFEYFRPEFATLVREVRKADREPVTVKDHVANVIKAMYGMGLKKEEVYRWLKPLLDMIVVTEIRLKKEVSETINKLGIPKGDNWNDAFDGAFFSVPRLWQSFSLKDCAEFLGDQEWFKKGQDAFDARQARFVSAKAEVNKVHPVRFESVVGHISLVPIVSDNDQIGPAARYCNHGIIVQMNSLGNVQITTDHRREIDLRNVAAALRQKELELLGVKHDLSWDELCAEGTLEILEQWHLHEGARGQLYNGTLSHSGVQPTMIPIDEIVKIIIRVLARRDKKTTLPAVKEVPRNGDNVGVALERAKPLGKLPR